MMKEAISYSWHGIKKHFIESGGRFCLGQFIIFTLMIIASVIFTYSSAENTDIAVDNMLIAVMTMVLYGIFYIVKSIVMSILNFINDNNLIYAGKKCILLILSIISSMCLIYTVKHTFMLSLTGISSMFFYGNYSFIIEWCCNVIYPIFKSIKAGIITAKINNKN